MGRPGIPLVAPAAGPIEPGGRDVPRAGAARPEEAAAAFEAMLLGELLRPVLASAAGSRAGTDMQGPFGSMLVDEYAKLLAARGGLGLRDALVHALAGTAAGAGTERS